MFAGTRGTGIVRRVLGAPTMATLRTLTLAAGPHGVTTHWPDGWTHADGTKVTWSLDQFGRRAGMTDSAGTVRYAYDRGIRFFETAESYGDMHRMLGVALKGVPRDRFVIATKVYHHFYPDGRRHGDLSADYIAAACDASTLSNLWDAR